MIGTVWEYRPHQAITQTYIVGLLPVTGPPPPGAMTGGYGVGVSLTVVSASMSATWVVP
jgi:hypothetical protein